MAGGAEEEEEHVHDPDLMQDQPIPLDKFVIEPPQIRLPARIRKGQVLKVQIKFKHPSRTGLRMLAEHKFVKDRPAFFVRRMKVFYRRRLLCRYEMTSALSDIPIVTFTLRATHESPLRVVFTDSKGKIYDVERLVRFTPS